MTDVCKKFKIDKEKSKWRKKENNCHRNAQSESQNWIYVDDKVRKKRANIKTKINGIKKERKKERKKKERQEVRKRKL